MNIYRKTEDPSYTVSVTILSTTNSSSTNELKLLLGQRKVFNKWCWEIDHHKQKQKDHYLTTFKKINS